jgi:hypothetical protein
VRGRKITREKKNHPSLDVIRTTLRRCQEIILAKGYLPKQILNLDETAINFGVGPTHVFASSTASRGSQEVSDWKGRITGVPTVDAEGGFLPTMFILRHSKSSAKCSDQTRMRVIQNLHQRTGFTRQDGWEFKKWERELEMPDEKRIKQKQNALCQLSYSYTNWECNYKPIQSME